MKLTGFALAGFLGAAVALPQPQILGDAPAPFDLPTSSIPTPSSSAVPTSSAVLYKRQFGSSSSATPSSTSAVYKRQEYATPSESLTPSSTPAATSSAASELFEKRQFGGFFPTPITPSSSPASSTPVSSSSVSISTPLF